MSTTKQSLQILVLITLIILVCGNVFGKMVQMNDQELNEITAGGFSKVELINDGTYDIASMQFNVQVSTYTDIDSLKMGYWNNGNGLGWDQNWTNVQMGSSTSDLKLNGYIFQAKFTNINDPANRQLQEVKLGFTDVTGTLTANFASLSKINGPARDQEGVKTYQFNHDPLILTIKCTGADAGIWFDFGGAQGN